MREFRLGTAGGWRYQCNLLVASMAMILLLAPTADAKVPIGGFTPQVVFGLTNEFAPDTSPGNFFEAVPSSGPGGSTFPLSGSPHYEVALFDTGAQASLITDAANQAFSLAGSGSSDFIGTEVIEITGIGGSEFARIDDPLGVYMAGLGEVTGIGPLTVNTSALRGHTSISLATLDPASSLFNVMGLPIAAQYASAIRNSQPQFIDIGGETRRTPNVELHPTGSGGQGIVRSVDLILEVNPLVGTGTPIYVFNLNNILSGDPLHENPSSPTAVVGAFYMSADLTDDAITRLDRRFFLDTGAQISVASETLAASLGFDVVLDTPEFTVQITGGGGSIASVPGFFVDQLVLNSSGGLFTIQDVPFVVLDVPNPSGVGSVDGILGMNLFTDRDLIIDPGLDKLFISDPVHTTHTWTTPAATETWGTAGNWAGAGVPAIDWIAEVKNPSGSAQQAVVTVDSTVNQLVVGSATSTMDVVVQNGATLTTFGAAIVEAGGGIVLEGGTLDATGVEVRGGSISGSGVVAGEVISLGTVSPGASAGTIAFTGSFDQVTQGTLVIEVGGTTPGTGHDQVTVDGAVTLAGTLDVSLINGFTPGSGNAFTILTTAGGLAGTFDTENLPALGGPLSLDVVYSANSVVLQVLSSLLLGDANNDGAVTADDLLAVQQNFGSVGPNGDGTDLGDANDDGVVTAEDLISVQQNFGNTLGGAGAAVPEPAAVAVLLVAAGVVGGRRGRPVQ